MQSQSVAELDALLPSILGEDHHCLRTIAGRMGSGLEDEDTAVSEQTCLHHCGTALEERLVTRSQEYQGCWYVIENLPALVCPQCGETYYTPQTHDLVVRLITSGEIPARVESVAVFDAALLNSVSLPTNTPLHTLPIAKKRGWPRRVNHDWPTIRIATMDTRRYAAYCALSR